mmetsp:Transcript_62252/g.157280  ORF Transcript_62252/g.157280 Transcript_62252/m.157280 type:complete len:301 (+) Transcript_62252:149-1051(+)
MAEGNHHRQASYRSQAAQRGGAHAFPIQHLLGLRAVGSPQLPARTSIGRLLLDLLLATLSHEQPKKSLILRRRRLRRQHQRLSEERQRVAVGRRASQRRLRSAPALQASPGAPSTRARSGHDDRAVAWRVPPPAPRHEAFRAGVPDVVCAAVIEGVRLPSGMIRNLQTHLLVHLLAHGTTKCAEEAAPPRWPLTLLHQQLGQEAAGAVSLILASCCLHVLLQPCWPWRPCCPKPTCIQCPFHARLRRGADATSARARQHDQLRPDFDAGSIPETRKLGVAGVRLFDARPVLLQRIPGGIG